MVVCMRTFLLLLSISFFIIGCGKHTPQYISKTNQYSFNFINTRNGYLFTESLVYTFKIESLERTYTKDFCAGLTNCSSNINNVKNSSIFGNFDLSVHPIVNNKMGITKVSIYRLIYQTTGEKNDLRKVSGALFIPDISSHKIKGIILYFHPTFFDRNSTPSYGITKNNQDNTIAAIFASNGYVVVAPDYIGMGIDKTTPHPFILYPQVNANDGLSMLTATKKFFNKKHLLIKPNLPLFVTGYSEGGNYALWFSRLYQQQVKFKQITDNNGFKLQQILPAAGAYDLSKVVYDYLFSNINVFNKNNLKIYNSIVSAHLKPALTSFAMVSYAYYNQHANYNLVFNNDFFSMNCSYQSQKNCNFDDKHLNIAHIFNQSGDITILQKIYNAAKFKSNTTSYVLFTNQTNSVYPLLNPHLYTNANFIQLLSSADVYAWHSTVPTTLINFSEDSIVSPYNTIYAYQGMLANGSSNLAHITIDNRLIKSKSPWYLPNFNVDHHIGLPYIVLVVIHQINQRTTQ